MAQYIYYRFITCHNQSFRAIILYCVLVDCTYMGYTQFSVIIYIEQIKIDH